MYSHGQSSISLVIIAESINWRAQLVYSPHVIRELWPQWDGTERSHERAQEIAGFMNAREKERERDKSTEDKG
jgi:hypothetical protein